MYKYLMALLAAAAITVSAGPCMAQQPTDLPPFENENGRQETDVSVIKKENTESFIETGTETVVNNNVTADGDTNTITVDDEPHDERQSSLNEQPKLSRRELRRMRKEAKHTPPYIRDLSRDTYIINSGQKTDVLQNTEVVISESSLTTVEKKISDSLDMALSAPQQTKAIAEANETADSLANLAPRERRELERMQRHADTTLYRHSPLFRDTLKIAPLTAISAVVPGFGQFYNGDYWKIPVLYATAGTALALGIQQHKQYVRYRSEYDYLTGRTSFSTNRALIDPVQTKMIQHNTWRQVLFGTAIASYVYFLCDAVINYPAADKNPVKTATTLSMICPGAGQIYNGSFWKVPLVVGGFASFIYVIDWNNRGLQRYTTAIKLASDNDPDTNPDSSFSNMSVDQMKSYQQMYRRNRDLAIILTAAFYLLNVMDAHVDAHMKDFDVSSDLACRLRIQPTIEPMYAMNSYQYSFGMGLSLTF